MEAKKDKNVPFFQAWQMDLKNNFNIFKIF
jgi:hypothetical protein